MVLCLVLFAPCAVRGQLVAVSWEGEYFAVDVQTGEANLVGATGFERLNSLCVGPGGRLFTFGVLPDLIELDLETGVGSVVGSVDDTEVSGEDPRVRAIAWVGGAEFFVTIQSGIDYDDWVSLWRFDLGEMRLHQVRAYAPRTRMQALAFSPTGELYGWFMELPEDREADITRRLVRIDTSNGNLEFLTDPLIGESEPDIQSLEFVEGGALMGIRRHLYIFAEDGLVTELRGPSPRPDIRGFAYVPELFAGKARIASVRMHGGGWRLALDRPPIFLSRQTIGVEYSPDLSAGSWIDLGDFSGTDGESIFIDSDPDRADRRKGFYRGFVRPEPAG